MVMLVMTLSGGVDGQGLQGGRKEEGRKPQCIVVYTDDSVSMKGMIKIRENKGKRSKKKKERSWREMRGNGKYCALEKLTTRHVTVFLVDSTRVQRLGAYSASSFPGIERAIHLLL